MTQLIQGNQQFSLQHLHRQRPVGLNQHQNRLGTVIRVIPRACTLLIAPRHSRRDVWRSSNEGHAQDKGTHLGGGVFPQRFKLRFELRLVDDGEPGVGAREIGVDSVLDHLPFGKHVQHGAEGDAADAVGGRDGVIDSVASNQREVDIVAFVGFVAPGRTESELERAGP